jgi:hypothetical protein
MFGRKPGQAQAQAADNRTSSLRRSAQLALRGDAVADLIAFREDAS